MKIEILLSDWGAWKRRENRTALGYPDRAAFATLRVDGLRRADPDVFLVDDALLQVDKCIEDLNPESRVMVMAQYVWLGNLRSKLKRLGIARSRYYAGLDFAHKQIQFWLGA